MLRLGPTGPGRDPRASKSMIYCLFLIQKSEIDAAHRGAEIPKLIRIKLDAHDDPTNNFSLCESDLAFVE
ncbi:hypothetical protein NL676_007333 [Syzygium grande]|nr:hypothetical protein NL676_007333 [Syzygium grande]